MADINKLYQSEFLRAEDLKGQARRVTIESASVEVIGQGEKAAQKVVLRFVSVRKRLPANKVNALSISSLYGPMTEDWRGKEIELRPEKVLFQGQLVPAIRVYPPRPAATTATVAAAARPAAPAAAAPSAEAPADAGDAWEAEAVEQEDGDVFPDDLPWQK